LPAAGEAVTALETLEVNELFTFDGSKKRPAYAVTVVERQMRCVVSWAVCELRTLKWAYEIDSHTFERRHFY
jgi:hypothetical protein